MAYYLKSAWYAAAFESELSDESILSRTFLGERVALFKGRGGEAVALRDQCPHRFALLSGGVLSGGVVECPYHGLRFNGTGACVHSPHGDGVIPERARVRTYPLALKWNCAWIWMGDPNLADPATIPDLSPIDQTNPDAVNRGYMHTQANYELVTDNLMDLSHADYVHRQSLNTGGSLSPLKPRVSAIGPEVDAYWSCETDRIVPLFRSAVRDPNGVVKHSFRMTWQAPANLLLHVTARDADLPEEADESHVTAHLLTPETEFSTHYFVLGARSWDTHNKALNETITDALMAAFTLEDKPMLQSVQESMGAVTDLWSLEPVILPCDPGPVHARRTLARMIKAEREAAASMGRMKTE